MQSESDLAELEARRAKLLSDPLMHFASRQLDE